MSTLHMSHVPELDNALKMLYIISGINMCDSLELLGKSSKLEEFGCPHYFIGTKQIYSSHTATLTVLY